jgi:hypothetical protein
MQINNCNAAYKQNPAQRSQIISVYTEIGFDKIQHPFMMLILKKPGIKGMYFNTEKTTYDKSIGNIILKKGKTDHFL